MRNPINPVPGASLRFTSYAATLTVELFEQQPEASTPALLNLPATDGVYSDDASRPSARQLTLNLASRPADLVPGTWVRPTIGIRVAQPVVYRLPAMLVTDVQADLSRMGGASLTAEDPAVVLNGRPWERDTTITGTLRSVVADACTLALDRPTDVSGVPALPVPAAILAEFGAGRWDTCLHVADALGVDLRFTDPGDVVGRLRSTPPPSASSIVERALVQGGRSHTLRIPTLARVLVTRGSDVAALYGSADLADVGASSPPAWYLPYEVVDRLEGDPTTSQAQADALAVNLLRVRLSDLDTYDAMPILPAPWLEAGVDTVEYGGVLYWVRALTMGLPFLQTAVTLRRAS